MTKFITAIAAALFISTSASSQSPEACYKASDIVSVVSEARDRGFPPTAAVQVLLSEGVPKGTAINVIYFVYKVHSDSNTEEVVAAFLNNCIGDSA